MKNISLSLFILIIELAMPKQSYVYNVMGESERVLSIFFLILQHFHPSNKSLLT